MRLQSLQSAWERQFIRPMRKWKELQCPHKKNLCTLRLRDLTKMTFSHDKISMSMSSSDEYIQVMFRHVDIYIWSRSLFCILNVFWFYKYSFLQSIAQIVYTVCYIFCVDIYKSAWGRSLCTANIAIWLAATVSYTRLLNEQNVLMPGEDCL